MKIRKVFNIALEYSKDYFNHKSKRNRVVSVYSSCIFPKNGLAVCVDRGFEG